MWYSGVTYSNRYGDTSGFKKVGNNIYEFWTTDDMKYCRFGGQFNKEGTGFETIEFFDPSGGPFVELGMFIDGKSIKEITSDEYGLFVRVGD